MTLERDTYWNDDRGLTTVHLGHADWSVWMRSHIAPEHYRGTGSETLFQLSSRQGERTYVQSRMYMHIAEPTNREQRVADAQAWYYGADHIIVLWELIAASWSWQPNTDPREDLVLRSLWRAYERFLVEQFPEAERLFTTWEESPYERADWEGFITALGYAQTSPDAFSKPIARNRK